MTLYDAADRLFEKNLISQNQKEQIKIHADRRFFSLRAEILFLLFAGVSLFCTGAGIITYEHIGSIGHLVALFVLFCLALVCFYFPFKRHPGFQKERVYSERHVDDHLTLASSLLAGLFIGYAQYQFSMFGPYSDLATLSASILYFFLAYYFDHKGILSLAISTLFTAIGFSLSADGILRNLDDGATLGYLALGVSVLLLLWNEYAFSIGLKQHFRDTFHNICLHVICISVIANLNYPFWLFALVAGVAAIYYFNRLSALNNSIQMQVFVLIYGAIMLTILLAKTIDWVDLEIMAVYVTPFYIVGLTLFFIKRLRNFKTTSANDRVQP